MANRRRIKVLVVDDSLVFRQVLVQGLSADPMIEVVAAAKDPFEARDLILEHEPDVMTCDIEMPRMSGIEFIRRLLPQYPLPVIVVSTISGAVFDAMNAGAVDFTAKPDVRSAQDVGSFLRDMTHKVKAAASARVDRPSQASPVTPAAVDGVLDAASRLIAIGASTGGTEAIQQLLRSLPSESVPGIAIVQHIPPVFSRMFADRLAATTGFAVKEARTGDRLEPGTVLVAPGDRHMRVKRSEQGYKVECFEGERVNGHCPSVDVLFESVAKEAGPKAIGVVLTGMGYDGAKGLLSMKRRGANTIAQDQASSVVYGMPKAAFEIGGAGQQLPLQQMGSRICKLLDNR